MVRLAIERRLFPCALLFLVLTAAACRSTLRDTTPSVTPPQPATAESTATAPAPPVAQAPAEDPVPALIATSDGHFAAGQAHLEIEKEDEPASIDELLALSDTIAPTIEGTPELKQAVESDLRAVVHDVPIPLNQKVLAYIALFQGRLRDFIQEGLTRGAKYLPMIQNVFRAEGLPLDLAYVPLIESAFKPNALSRARARGVWQFVRGTGLENGLRQDWYIDERSDPEKSTMAAAKYLSMLSTMFDGDWHLALASYNGGPGRVQRAQTRGKATDFWKLAAKRGLLPRETREYVPMILAAMVVARNPQQYGFEIDADAEALVYDTVTLPGPVDLRRVAEWAGTTIDVIQGLNPELRRWTTPVKDTDYAVKVPSGTALLVSAHLAETAPSDLATLNYYTVKRGDTVTTIAKTLRVGRADLAEANGLKATSRLATGQRLLVPRETTALMAARAERPAPGPAARAAASRAAGAPRVSGTTDAVLPAVARRPAATDAELVKTSYRIKTGDTLVSIARAHRTTVAALQRWNGMSGTRIRAGERLTIYTARAN